jgi:hypothetical protein
MAARHTCCNYAEKIAVLLNSYDDVHLWEGAEALPSTALQAGPAEGLFVVKEVLTGLGMHCMDSRIGDVGSSSERACTARTW